MQPTGGNFPASGMQQGTATGAGGMGVNYGSPAVNSPAAGMQQGTGVAVGTVGTAPATSSMTSPAGGMVSPEYVASQEQVSLLGTNISQAKNAAEGLKCATRKVGWSYATALVAACFVTM